MSAAILPLPDPQLDACVDAVVDNLDPSDEAGLFEINNEDRASRTLWKLARLNSQLAADEATYLREREILDEFIEEARHRNNRARKFLEDLLTQYHRTLHGIDGRKTIRFPAGELKATKQQDRWEIDSDEALIEWAEGNGWKEIVRRPDPQIDRNAVKRTFNVASDGTVIAPDGEVVPGVHVADGGIKFSVKPREIGQ